MNTFSLPELGYDYAAIEPQDSARIMELHHSTCHRARTAPAFSCHA